MKKNTVWCLSMVSQFHDCSSCGEDCGYVWFVNIKFDLTTGLPVCINTKSTPEGDMLVVTEATHWCHKDGARQSAKDFTMEFVKAAQRPLYKLENFCQGGAYEQGILEDIRSKNAKFEQYGIPIEKVEVPKKILPPSH